VPSPGIRKAALLLMALDPSTAAELLRSANPETIKQIAAELAYLQSAGQAPPAVERSAKEFAVMISGLGQRARREEGFVQRMLADAVGERQSKEMLREVEGILESRDPFRQVRSADVKDIATALSGESGQVASLVLSELPSAKSAALLALLPEDIRAKAVCGMTGERSVPVAARQRVAGAIHQRLQAMRTGPKEEIVEEAEEETRQQKLRKVALLLRGLGSELRDSLITGVSDQDPEVSQQVQDLMVIWEDIPILAERSLQESLRTLDSRKLALALHEADAAVIAKIRENMSERARAMLEEEISLMSKPKKEEVEEAREGLLSALREMNKAGELSFEEA
jgi:flagellar motor switch protein FliG